MVWGSKLIYVGLLRFRYEYFFKNAGKTVVKGSNRTLLNADRVTEIIGDFLEVGSY